MKKSVVESLRKQIILNSKHKENSKGGISFNIGLSKFDELFYEAKELEKEQQEQYGLMEIELSHTKTLLASCEKALEDRDKQQERSYSEEEVGELVYNIIGQYGKHYGMMIDGAKINELFKQFKKK